MTRHVPRRDRWQRQGPSEHRSVEGHVVRFQKGAWWAEVSYHLLHTASSPEETSEWKLLTDRLGPFKRPRNAMVEAERHATLLRNRHGPAIRFVGDDHPAAS
jgi:hypothetical protein